MRSVTRLSLWVIPIVLFIAFCNFFPTAADAPTHGSQELLSSPRADSTHPLEVARARARSSVPFDRARRSEPLPADVRNFIADNSVDLTKDESALIGLLESLESDTARLVALTEQEYLAAQPSDRFEKDRRYLAALNLATKLALGRTPAPSASPDEIQRRQAYLLKSIDPRLSGVERAAIKEAIWFRTGGRQ